MPIPYFINVFKTSPYGMRVKSHRKLHGNEQYEGFCIDLVKELSSMNNNFSINFIISKDGKSGSPTLLKNKSVVWDGMIGAIIRGVSYILSLTKMP